MRKLTEADREKLCDELVKEGESLEEAKVHSEQAFKVYNALYEMGISDEAFASFKKILEL